MPAEWCFPTSLGGVADDCVGFGMCMVLVLVPPAVEEGHCEGRTGFPEGIEVVEDHNGQLINIYQFLEEAVSAFTSPKSQVPSPKSRVPSPKSQVSSPKTPSPKSQVKSEVSSPKSRVSSPKSQVSSPKSQVPRLRTANELAPTIHSLT